ncbi:MAG: FlgO family outer membrane protein, partial [Myxococcota bacterium]
MLELLMTVVLAAGPLEAPGVGQLTDSLATHLAAHRSQTIGVPSFTRADGQPAELGAWVADEISQRLSRRFKVVERVKLKTLIEEDTLAQLKFTDGTGAVAKRSGVDLFVLGNVTRLKDGIDVNARVVRGADGRILFTASTLLPLGLAHADALPEQSAAPLTLSTLFLAERKVDGRYEDIQIRDGSTLRSGDGIKISFEVNRDAYVY